MEKNRINLNKKYRARVWSGIVNLTSKKLFRKCLEWLSRLSCPIVRGKLVVAVECWLSPELPTKEIKLIVSLLVKG